MKSKTIWERFGFRQNPYSKEPLGPTERSYDLFTGRTDETAKFATLVEANPGGVIVVSGEIGVGKTSFVNMQQHFLSANNSNPRLLPSIILTSPEETDNAPVLARRIVQNTAENVATYYATLGKRVPKETQAIRALNSYKPVATGKQFTAGPIGYGEDSSLQTVSDTTLETWCWALRSLAKESRGLGGDGLLVCLDNVETLTIKTLCAILMAFRDTLFVIEDVWWVIIGQAGLHGMIERENHRISERLSGDGVELPLFTASDFHDLIERRVKAFAQNSKAKSPLSPALHSVLFDASGGAVRFALQTADILLTRLVTDWRKRAMHEMGRVAEPILIERSLDAAMKAVLTSDHVPNDLAITELQDIALARARHMGLTKSEVDGIKKFDKNDTTLKEYRRFGFKQEEAFISNFIQPLHEKRVLIRAETDGEITYRLRGHVQLCHRYGILNKILSR